MGATVFGDKVSVTGTATSLTTLLGLTERKYLGEVAIRAATANGGTVYFGKSNLTTSTHQLGFLVAGDAISVSITNALASTDEFYLIASVPGDIVHVLCIG